jgi:GMC oxidoreductase
MTAGGVRLNAAFAWTDPARERDNLTIDRALLLFHPVGTCAIGAVVDERGRVYGYESLVVADASIMPTIPRTI